MFIEKVLDNTCLIVTTEHHLQKINEILKISNSNQYANST